MISFNAITVYLSDALQLRLKELDVKVRSATKSTTQYEVNATILIREAIAGITSGMATILLFNPPS